MDGGPVAERADRDRPVGPLGNGTVPSPAVRTLTGGVVAHNDEARIERAIRSLLRQELPTGTRWGPVWVVASGCTDGTVPRAAAVAAEDPRVRLFVDPERRGKSAAIRQVLDRAEGESVVLLNSDAEAAPGAVAALLAKAEGKPGPFAVMGRPIVPDEASGDWADTIRWMWELHHELHSEYLSDGRGAHLSDELLLLSRPTPGVLGEGIINDGAFLAVWLSRHGGSCWYAPDGRVSIDIPRTRADHLAQRRRIYVGNAQVRRVLGVAPTTLPRYLFERPSRALRAMRTMIARPAGLRHFLRVLFWERVAWTLATWDRLPPARDHVHWRRIARSTASETSGSPPTPENLSASSVDVNRRVESLLTVASDFGTGIPLEQLTDLLPSAGPASQADLARWLESHPEIARVANGRAYARAGASGASEDRTRRGATYWASANALFDGPLRFTRPWLRCVGVSGSAAYGEPEPGDDLDFLAVARTGSLWWFLATTFARMRVERWRRGPHSVPSVCFNFVMDDRRAPAEFASARGFLFAREALMVRTIEGEPYYRGLLGTSPWIGREVPRLYRHRAGAPSDCAPSRSPAPIRALNALVFPVLAAYLQLVGLLRNHRARRQHRDAAAFRTLTSWHRLAFASDRFETIRHRYDEPAALAPRGPGTVAGSRSPAEP